MFSSVEADVVGLAVYFYIYVCLLRVDMVTRNDCSYVLSCIKTFVVSNVWQEIPQSFDPHLQPFRYVMLLLTVDLQQSMASLFTHG